MILSKTELWAFCMLLSLLPFASVAQGTGMVENFETYTAGARLCTQAPAYWFTWNNGAGTAEDPEVTDSVSLNGYNSLLVKGANDVLLNLNGKTSGRYEVSFFTRIADGKTGFYGLLQQFSGSESDWGVQCFFDANGKGSVEAAGNTAGFNYIQNQWMPVRNIIDLDNDHAEIYISSVLVYEWKWSLGLSAVPGIPKLDALNFFAWNASQRQPFMHVDSLIYKELPAPGAPLNFIASVSGDDVTLSWDAPSGEPPLGYKIYRNSEVIAPDITVLNYADTDVYPGNYSYSVKAIYVSGLSQPAGPVDLVIAGGTSRKFVLLEIATGTWCTYCPGSAMGADDLMENGENVAVIEYHDNDAYSNPDSDHRNAYYNVQGFPTANFDGVNSIAGGNMTQSMYPAYLPVYTKNIEKLALFELTMQVTNTGNPELRVQLTAKNIYPYTNPNLRIHLALTETHIPENWQNIMTEVNYVCRKMYPDYTGAQADFSGDSVLNFTYDIAIDTSYNLDNCALVAFLQDNATKEVLQTEKINLSSLGKDEFQEIRISVYPNPAFDILFIESEIPIKDLRVFDMAGRFVLSGGTGKMAELDVRSLKPGLYTLSVLTQKGLAIKKVSIR